MVRIAAYVDGIGGGAACGYPSELIALPDVGPAPGLATEHVRLVFATLPWQQHAVGELHAPTLDGGEQHLQLVVLQLLEQSH